MCPGNADEPGQPTINDAEARLVGHVDGAIRRASGMPSMRAAVNATTSGASKAAATGSSAGPTSSSTSSGRSTRSTTRSAKPTTVKGLVAQINQLATDVINGDVQGEDLDRARLYSNLVRTTAQLVNSEVTRARFLREIPDLTLE